MKKISDEKIIEELFDRGAHLGHKKSKINPRSKKFVYKVESGISIIDLTKTVEMMHKAEEFLKEASKKGKKMLVVATKKTLSEYVRDLCQKQGIPYISKKWPPGLLTNFDTIHKNIRKLRQMRKEKEEGEWQKFPKHERVKLQKKLNRLEKIYGGIEQLNSLPDILLVVDSNREKNAVIEANKLKIKTVGVVDTNSNPDDLTYPIPSNDDLLEPVAYILDFLINIYTGKNNKK